MLAVSLIFKSILNPATGLLNTSLRGAGLDFMAQRWLTDPNLALSSVIGVDTWRGVGYIMVILIAGLKRFQENIMRRRQLMAPAAGSPFSHITLPLLDASLRGDHGPQLAVWPQGV